MPTVVNFLPQVSLHLSIQKVILDSGQKAPYFSLILYFKDMTLNKDSYLEQWFLQFSVQTIFG